MANLCYFEVTIVICPTNSVQATLNAVVVGFSLSDCFSILFRNESVHVRLFFLYVINASINQPLFASSSWFLITCSSFCCSFRFIISLKSTLHLHCWFFFGRNWVSNSNLLLLHVDKCASVSHKKKTQIKFAIIHFRAFDSSLFYFTAKYSIFSRLICCDKW